LARRIKKNVRRTSGNRPRRNIRWKRILFQILFWPALAVLLVLWFYHWRASKFDINGVTQMKERSTVFDMDGKIWGRMQGENRVPVKLEDVSPMFVASLLAREDTRFFSHWGIDPMGLARAVVKTAQGKQQGGSTLTQQLARNSFDALGQRKSMDRKLLEVFVSLRIENSYKKAEILEHYMNRIYFGSGVYGIEMAAKVYFGKPAAQLTLSEAAMIAGIIRAPTRASPFSNYKRAVAERDMVLDRLKTGDCDWIREKYEISEESIEAARKSQLKVVSAKRLTTQENYAMDAIMRDLDILLDDEQQIQGGLRIYTTIDPALQDESQKALDRQLTKIEARPGYPHPKKSAFSEEMRAAEKSTEYLQGAVVVLDNRNGAVRALVGGRDYRESKFNRALDSMRQIGSTFKPFVYAAAFEKGMSLWTPVSDEAFGRGEIASAPNWTPDNSDDKYGGMLPAEEGLIRSRNTMTVRIGERAGLDAVKKTADAVGLEGMPLAAVSYIGTFGATLKDLVSAYSVLANDGVRRQSYIIERIDNSDGDVIYRASHVRFSSIPPDVARTTTSALAKVFERGTASAAKDLGWKFPAAGKTGTTNDYHDAWFVGYSSSLTCGVWVGLDKPETIVPKGYGSTLALPVWVDVMKRAGTDRYPALAFKPSEGRRTEVSVPKKEPQNEEGGLRKPEAKTEPGLLRSFRKFLGGD
jgi:penicillin-binding protein 1A